MKKTTTKKNDTKHKVKSKTNTKLMHDKLNNK